MNIQITDFIRKEAIFKYNLFGNDIISTVDNSDYSQDIEGADFSVRLFLKYFKKEEEEFYILVQGFVQDEQIRVDTAWKIYSDLIEEFTPSEPIKILQSLADKFGNTVHIGNITGKLIYHQTIPVESNDMTKIMGVDSIKGHSFIQQILVKLNETGNNRSVECAIAYCIDTTNYIEWLNSHIK